MSDIVDKKSKNKPVTDLYILAVSVNGQVRGSFKMEGFGLPDFRTSWEGFLDGFVNKFYAKENAQDAKENTESVSLPENTNIEAGFETCINGDTIKGYYSPFFSIGI
jgi:hypothetical protein